MTASKMVDEYLARLRTELELAEAADTDDIVAEVRSLLTDAAGEDADAVAAQIERLGEPEELAAGILMERGSEASRGVPSGVWWRLGIAAPIDILIGLSLPAYLALPLFISSQIREPRYLAFALSVAIGFASLAWPFFIWRPWRRGGRSLSPGMSLAGLAILRSPGSWRLVPLKEIPAETLRPRRRIGLAVLIVLISAALIVGTVLPVFSVGLENFANVVMGVSWAERDPDTVPPSRQQLQYMAGQVYWEARRGEPVQQWEFLSTGSDGYVDRLRRHILKYDIRSAVAEEAEPVEPGVFRFLVQEFASDSKRVGTSRFTIARRHWREPGGREAADWIVVEITLEQGTPGE